MARDRTTPPTLEAAAVRAAGDMLGVNQLIAKLGIAERTFHSWASGKRPVPLRVLPELRIALVERRQQCGKLVEQIRELERAAGSSHVAGDNDEEE
jgi:hypothetical protein